MSVDELKEALSEFFSPAISSVLEFIVSCFGTVFDWFYDFFVNNILGTIYDFGKSGFASIADLVSNSITNGTFIFFIIGALIVFPIVKICINIIRG